MKKKINYLGLIIIVLLSLILLKDIRDSDVFLTMKKILKPFVYGFIISYFLNPVIEWLKIKTKIKGIYLLFIVYLILGGIVYISIKFFVPILMSNLKFFLKDLPNSIDKLLNILDLKIFNRFNIELSEEIFNKVKLSVQNIKTKGIDFMMIVHYTKYVTDFLMNLVIGMVISVYMIKDKEKLLNLLKKIMYSFLDEAFIDSIMIFFSKLDRVFYRFLLGKIIDSAIMGILFYIIALLFRVPYAITMAMLFGLTNVIPYFGPLMGIIICSIISLIYAPDYALIVLVMSFVLQQFDGFYLGPKILGGKVGLSPFWTMTTILISGGLFGITGMLLAVPTASVIKDILNINMEKRLIEKNISILEKSFSQTKNKLKKN